MKLLELDPVSDLDRPFEEQDQPRHEVGHDRLQAEADAHPEDAPAAFRMGKSAG